MRGHARPSHYGAAQAPNPVTASKATTEFGGRPFGRVLAILGRPTSGIGLAAISSEVYRKVHSTFHVDQHR